MQRRAAEQGSDTGWQLPCPACVERVYGVGPEQAAHDPDLMAVLTFAAMAARAKRPKRSAGFVVLYARKTHLINSMQSPRILRRFHFQGVQQMQNSRRNNTSQRCQLFHFPEAIADGVPKRMRRPLRS